jgi:hypothetical protein
MGTVTLCVNYGKPENSTYMRQLFTFSRLKILSKTRSFLPERPTPTCGMGAVLPGAGVWCGFCGCHAYQTLEEI